LTQNRSFDSLCCPRRFR